MLPSLSEMKRSTNTVCKLLTNFLLLILTCRTSNAQNDFIVKLLSNQMEFLLRQQDHFINDIKQLTEKLENEISTRKKLTEKVLFTESLVFTQQREIGRIKAHLLREHDRNRYLIHNNTLLATELNRLRKGLTGEKKKRYILTNGLVELRSDIKQLSNSSGSSLFVNCCKYYPSSNHSESTGTKSNNTDINTPTEKVYQRVMKSRGVTYSGDPINSKDEREARDCHALHKLKYSKNGVYRITLSGNESANVFCNLRESARNWNIRGSLGHQKGWIVVQRRKNGTLNFDRSWKDYQNGFGDYDGDYWLGNDVLFRLINSSQSSVFMYIRYFAKSYSYYYRYFMRALKMKNGSQGYQLIYSGSTYTTVGGNLGLFNKSYFATKDNTTFHDDRCPPVNGGWWYTTWPRCKLRDQNPNSKSTTIVAPTGGRYLGFNSPKGDINITGSEILMFVDQSSGE